MFLVSMYCHWSQRKYRRTFHSLTDAKEFVDYATSLGDKIDRIEIVDFMVSDLLSNSWAT